MHVKLKDYFIPKSAKTRGHFGLNFKQFQKHQYIFFLNAQDYASAVKDYF